MKWIWMMAIILLIGNTAKAQYRGIMIRGEVRDALSGDTLEQASASLLRLPEGTLTRQSNSGKHGLVMQRVPRGHYMLITSFIGYKKDTLDMLITTTDSTYHWVHIRLQKANKELMEVVVRSVMPPVTIRHDTVAYNADAYKTSPNATVEDLLKKLPGIEVDKDGNIMMQGKKVEKVYLDGQEFFLNDPRLATQMLTADMIAQVQVFDMLSDPARFTGIKEHSESKALNLKLKKNKKDGLFGKAGVTYGTPGVLQVGTNVLMLNNDTWLSGNARASRNDPGNGTSQNINHQDFNYKESWAGKWNAAINYIGNNNQNQSQQGSVKQTFLGDSSLTENRNHTSQSQNNRQGLNATIEFRTDSGNKLTYRPVFSRDNQSTTSEDSVTVLSRRPSGSYISSTGRIRNTGTSTGHDISNMLSFGHSFAKKRRTLFVILSQTDQEHQQSSNIYSDLQTFAPDGKLAQKTVIDQRYKQITMQNVYGVNLTYTEPLSANEVIDVGYNLTQDHGSSDKQSFNYDPASGKYDLPDTLTTNHFNQTNRQQRFSIGYNKLGQKFSYQLGLASQITDLTSLNQTNGDHIGQQVMNWYPRASLAEQLSKQENLNIVYNGNSTSPSLDQLQPVPDLSNPYLVKIGNPSLKQQFDHRLEISYNTLNPDNFTSCFIQASGTYSENKIIPSISVDPSGIQQIRYINVNGTYDVGANMTYVLPFGDQKHGIGKINTRLQYNRDIVFVNNEENRQGTLSWTEEISLNYNYADRLFLEVRASLNYNDTQYSIQQENGIRMLAQNYDADFSYEMPLGIRLSANEQLAINSKQGQLPGNSLSILNMSLTKNLFGDHAGELKLAGLDLFNAGNNFGHSIGANYIETTTNKVLNRVFQLSFLYNFKIVPKDNGSKRKNKQPQ